jgi:hypothetical protein
MATSRVSLWPFPAIWDSFFIYFNDIRRCEFIHVDERDILDSGGSVTSFSFCVLTGFGKTWRYFQLVQVDEAVERQSLGIYIR